MKAIGFYGDMKLPNNVYNKVERKLNEFCKRFESGVF